MTSELIEEFRDCRVLVIESNHATDLLRVSPYGRLTRARIGSEKGHLSNESLAEFVKDHLGRSVRCLVLMHLSRVNNLPELAEMTCREARAACGRDHVEIVVSCQGQIIETVELGRWSTKETGFQIPGQLQRVLPFDSESTNQGEGDSTRASDNCSGHRPKRRGSYSRSDLNVEAVGSSSL